MSETGGTYRGRHIQWGDLEMILLGKNIYQGWPNARCPTTGGLKYMVLDGGPQQMFSFGVSHAVRLCSLGLLHYDSGGSPSAAALTVEYRYVPYNWDVTHLYAGFQVMDPSVMNQVRENYQYGEGYELLPGIHQLYITGDVDHVVYPIWEVQTLDPRGTK